MYAAPFDVRLPVSLKDGQVDTVVQPDLCVVCDERKLDKQGCNGAPDLVIEILSPGNSAKEVRGKFELYEASGVLEYWLVYPTEESINRYRLNEHNTFVANRPLSLGDELTSPLFPGMQVKLDAVCRLRGLS